VRVEWHRRLREIERGADAVVAFIDRLAPPQDGRGVPPQDATPVERLQVRAEFVVGADGHDSMLRQLLGIASLRAGSPQPFAVFEIETIEPLDHEMKLVIGEWGLNVCWPLAENQCRWSFQILPVDPGPGHPAKERDRPIILRPPSDWDSSHRLRRFLAERAPWFKAKLRDILWVASVQFERRLVLHFGEGRCWLAGDAAHQSSPAGMHSLNLGLQEAADLAGKLKGILRDHSDKDVLQEYDRHHRAEAKRLLGMKAQAPGGLSLWAQRQYATLLGNLPVSGGDLDLLLEKL
jgi:2-polyprenyl-6-methoxyphenol hydroxylase-like FAD-dependent oxidoreductase